MTLFHDLLGKALTFALGLFLLLVVYRGANAPLVITIAAYLAAVVFVLSVISAGTRQTNAVSFPWYAAVAALATIVVAGLLGLLAISAETFASLPGREFYQPVIAYLSGGEQSVGLRVSLDPPRTATSLLVALTALAVAVAVPQLTRAQLLAVLGAFVLLAVFQALIGLIQLGLGSPSFLAYGSAVGGRRAAGTFVNKNHYATFLAMALPLLLMRSVGRFSFFTKRDRDTRLKRAWWGFATALTAGALVSSVSRAGTAAGFAVALITISICAWTARERGERFALVGIGALALGIASLAGIQLMVASLSGDAFEQGVESRHLLNQMSWAGVSSFFPVGAGLGSFATAFPRFQLEKFVGFVEHAHNDYLQILFELGLAGVVVLACLGIAAIAQCARLIAARKQRSIANPATACLLGTAAFAIHAWFDFPAHIPAVAWAATLLLAASTHPALVATRLSTRIASR